MIIRIIYIFGLNLVTYGGGGVYIPVYEHYYTQVFDLLSKTDYYHAISILNIIPGVTGGKLAGYAMYLEYGYFGMVMGILTFAASGIMLVIALDKILSQLKNNKYFIEVNKNIKPVVAGILFSITINFYQMASTELSSRMLLVISIIVLYFLVIRETKIFIIIFSLFVLFGLIYGFIL